MSVMSVVHKLSVKWERELTELHNASLDPVPRYLQKSHRSQLVSIVWQCRATRIHQTDTIERLHHGRVGVTADQNIHTLAELSLHRRVIVLRGPGVVEPMSDSQADASQVECVAVLETRVRREAPIPIATSRQHWGDALQLIQHTTDVDIAGVKDQVNVLEGLLHMWRHGFDVSRYVGISNKANAH